MAPIPVLAGTLGNNKFMNFWSRKSIRAVLVLMIFSLTTFDLTLVLAPKTHATCSTNPRIVNGGIISAIGDINTGDTITGLGSPCVINPDYAGIPTLTTYAEMKSTYYDRPSPGVYTDFLRINGGGKIQTTGGRDEVLYTSSSLTIDSCRGCVSGMTGGGGSNSFVIFIDGDLTINQDVLASNYTQGALVFIVQGNINIAPSVYHIDASLISQQQICDTYTGTSPCDSTPIFISPPNPLQINGNVIDLCDPNNNDPQHPTYRCTLANPIAFNRTFVDNSSTPAEQITTQPQDLVFLRDILSSTLTIQTQQ